MDIIAVQNKMIELGLCIRAIPMTRTFIYESRHKDRYPDGVVYYDEYRKVDMLRVVHQNDHGGKFMICRTGSGEIVRFNNRLYFDSIEDALNSMAEA
jgi:hypothetical protein